MAGLVRLGHGLRQIFNGLYWSGGAGESRQAGDLAGIRATPLGVAKAALSSHLSEEIGTPVILTAPVRGRGTDLDEGSNSGRHYTFRRGMFWEGRQFSWFGLNNSGEGVEFGSSRYS